MSSEDYEDAFVEKDYIIGKKAKGVAVLIQFNMHMFSDSN